MTWQVDAHFVVHYPENVVSPPRTSYLLRNLVEVQFASLSVELLFSQVLMSFHTSVLDLVTFSIEVKEK